METKTIFEKVDVNVELPNRNIFVEAFIGNIRLQYKHQLYSDGFWYSEMGEKKAITHWLKEVNDVFVLTEKEVEDIKSALNGSLQMLEQTQVHRKANNLTGGDVFLSCTIDEVKKQIEHLK